MNVEFEHIGYLKEFYIENKFIGFVKTEKDRDSVGFAGRKLETLSETIILENGRKIKAGIQVMTIIYPLNGKIKRG